MMVTFINQDFPTLDPLPDIKCWDCRGTLGSDIGVEAASCNIYPDYALPSNRFQCGSNHVCILRYTNNQSKYVIKATWRIYIRYRGYIHPYSQNCLPLSNSDYDVGHSTVFRHCLDAKKLTELDLKLGECSEKVNAFNLGMIMDVCACEEDLCNGDIMKFAGMTFYIHILRVISTLNAFIMSYPGCQAATEIDWFIQSSLSLPVAMS